MPRSCLRCLMFICLLAVCRPHSARSAPPDPGVGRLHIFKHADLVVTVPLGWRADSKWGVRRSSPPTMKLTGPGHPLEVLITPIWSTAGDTEFNSAAEVRKSANIAGRQALKDAMETSITLIDLNGQNAHGCYYTLTEKVTPAGAYEYLTNAVVSVGDLLVTATILHHQKDSDAFQEALGVLMSIDQPGVAGAEDGMAPGVDGGAKSVKSLPAPGSSTPANTGLPLNAPDGMWAVVMPGSFVKQAVDKNQSGTSVRYITADDPDGIRATVNIEPAAEPGNCNVARAAYWRKMLLDPIAKHDVTTREVHEKAIVLYITVDKQQDMNVFMVHRNMWINVHVSKPNFGPNDEPLFNGIVNGLGFVDVAKPAKK